MSPQEQVPDQGGDNLFAQASFEERGQLVELALSTIDAMIVRRYGVTRHNETETIDLGGAYECHKGLGSIGLSEMEMIPDAYSLAECLRVDGDQFSMAPGWNDIARVRDVAGLLIKATLDPENLFPIRRTRYRFLATKESKDPTYGVFNRGVVYFLPAEEPGGPDTQLVAFDVIPKELDATSASLMDITSFEVNEWMLRLINYRNKYRIPPLLS